jgi:hypothetical protein
MTPPSLRSLLVPVALMALFTTTAAQTYNAAYTVGSYISYYSSGTTLWDGITNPGDDQAQDIPIGFTFQYYGVSHTTLRVATNGYVTFPPASGTSFQNTAFPDVMVPNPVISPWWDDLRVADYGAVDRILWWYDGFLPGSRRLVVEWNSVSAYPNDASNYVFLNFQVQLLEDGNRIQFHYGGSGSVGSPVALSASTGIEDHTGTSGLTYSPASPGLTLAQFPVVGSIITFTPVLCGDCNQDGVTSILDALVAAQNQVGLYTLIDPGFFLCNVHGTLGGMGTPSAAVTILDALAIAQFSSGLLGSLSCSP